ncbi:hypothetical protein C8Q78DRAFT_1077512 [Trametes maxima]|nr:hypothetical protein C8Q78DRAFT_1077512 [Trametes maxima]
MDILEEIPQIPPTISLPSAGLTKAHLCVELGELLTTPIHIRNTIGDSDDDANDYPCQPIADPGAAAVYRVHIQLLDGQPPCPSLVIKIASELEGRNLASEAGMYQALECFQGNAIARMYGYFRAEINLTKLRIKPWSGKEYLGPRGDLDIFRMPNTAASLNIILLEELQPIPSRSLDDAQGREVRTDLLRIAEVLADAGVYYTDWNIANVMRPFPSPQGTHSTGMTDSCLSSDRTYSTYNVIQSIIITGLAKDNDGNDIPLAMSRTDPLPAKTTILVPDGGVYSTHEKAMIVKDVPDIPTVESTAPKRIELHVELDKVLAPSDGDDSSDNGGNDSDVDGNGNFSVGDGSGSTGEYDTDDYASPRANFSTVYRVRVLSQDGDALYVPPLVIKIAPERQGRKLALEAGAYQALECFHGSVIARAYGYFCAEVNLRQLRIKPWSGNKFDGPRGDLDIFRMPNTAASLNILVMEQLQPIPLHSLDKAEARQVQEDLTCMAEDLIKVGFEYPDWSTSNIMRPFPSPPGIPPTPSPFQNRAYSVLLVDLEEASRSNCAPYIMRDYAESRIEQILRWLVAQDSY